MILSLTIENFRSISSPLKLNLVAAKRLKEENLPHNSFMQNEEEVLKCLLLYGRNASGKSNVLLALKALTYLIEKSDKFKLEQKINPYEPFLFDENYKSQPVKFEIEFITVETKTRFNYRIEFTEDSIIDEALYFYPKGVKAKLFERNVEGVSFGDSYRGTKKNIENDLLQNQLFLSKSASSKVKYLNECYLFFKRYVFVSTIHDTEYDKSLIRGFSELLKDDNKLKSNLLELLKAADTSIQDFTIIENEKEIKFSDKFPSELKEKILEDHKYEVKTNHPVFKDGKIVGEEKLDLENESFGTKKLFAIGALILDTLDDGGIILIDELDKGLHPLLSQMLIKLFNSSHNNPKNAQLVFATHDSTLLDLDFLRRDQITFIDKNYEQNSIAYKLSDIKGVRKDIPVDKWYLSGRFKAIPVTTEPNLQF